MVTSSHKSIDKLLWGFFIVLCAAIVVGNYYFSNTSVLLRVAGGLLLAGLAIGIALKTALGQKIASLWLESINELRKMYWPTQKETLHTTLAVLAMVVVMGILLWTADFVLLRLVKWLTGHWDT